MAERVEESVPARIVFACQEQGARRILISARKCSNSKWYIFMIATHPCGFLVLLVFDVGILGGGSISLVVAEEPGSDSVNDRVKEMDEALECNVAGSFSRGWAPVDVGCGTS